MKKFFYFLIIFFTNLNSLQAGQTTEKGELSILTGFLKPEIIIECFQRGGPEDKIIFKVGFNKRSMFKSWVVHLNSNNKNDIYPGNNEDFSHSLDFLTNDKDQKFYIWTDFRTYKDNVDIFSLYMMIYNNEDLKSDSNKYFEINHGIWTLDSSMISQDLSKNLLSSLDDLRVLTINSSIYEFESKFLKHRQYKSEMYRKMIQFEPKKMNFFKCKKVKQ